MTSDEKEHAREVNLSQWYNWGFSSHCTASMLKRHHGLRVRVFEDEVSESARLWMSECLRVTWFWADPVMLHAWGKAGWWSVWSMMVSLWFVDFSIKPMCTVINCYNMCREVNPEIVWRQCSLNQSDLQVQMTESWPKSSLEINSKPVQCP